MAKREILAREDNSNADSLTEPRIYVVAQDKVMALKKKKKKIQKNWANFLQSQFTIYNINRKEAHPSHEYNIAYL